MSPLQKVRSVAFRSVAVGVRHLQVVGMMQHRSPLPPCDSPKASLSALQVEQAELLWYDVFDLGILARHPQTTQSAAMIVAPRQVSHHALLVVGIPATRRAVRLRLLHQPTLHPAESGMGVSFQILIQHCRKPSLSTAERCHLSLVGRFPTGTGIVAISTPVHRATWHVTTRPRRIIDRIVLPWK